MPALTNARGSHGTGWVPMPTRRRRIEESIDNWAFGHAFSTAPRRHLRHRPLESSQIPDLAANLRKVAQHQRMNFRAGIAVPIDEAEQAADFVEAEAKLPAAPHEAQSLEMVRLVNAKSAGAAAGRRHDADLLVIADRLDVHAALLRKLPDREHIHRLHIRPPELGKKTS